ncbi:U4/U6 small nuclear ribonucleoprotein Prp31 homolog [Selaginella moellendorffii]|uniref:U4/U6 small nuclear ribonucleoprotein Prp31 homolog n=1 Tax=Selaginella moellendorffii TaxID=88036 RepID=UPI000D1CCBF7|nr:U4/U6 small nuclear ribonucleoprotein Prp31 homolog [Selaginella moellendorffii]|eukprot:XP_002969016.2 U4/U6 small nuclear ribonucleoprotein Prp31 homolog [Selaginella moellendorffii]
MEKEIESLYDFVKTMYGRRFKELELMVRDPLDYARLVKKIGNKMDLSEVSLEDLPAPTALAISMLFSIMDMPTLEESDLQRVLDACDRIIELTETRKEVLGFLESETSSAAPNLSAILGSSITAKLVEEAGGLASLASMPACNVKLLGREEIDDLLGFSSATVKNNGMGHVFECEIVQSTPPPLRKRACRLVCSKAALAARVDATTTINSTKGGEIGRALREEILKTINKWQERPLLKSATPLPVPRIGESKKKRGGRRYQAPYGRAQAGGLSLIVRVNRFVYTSRYGLKYDLENRSCSSTVVKAFVMELLICWPSSRAPGHVG